MTTPSFMLAGSSHARVRARWIIARPFLLDTCARWIPTHARPCPLDPHTPVPAGSPCTPVCARWIPARPCLLDPRTPVPAGSPRTPMCVPTRSPRLSVCVPAGSPRTHASTRPMHARRMCTHGPHRARSYGPDARSLVGPPCTYAVSPHSRTPHPSHAYMRLLDVSCMHP